MKKNNLENIGENLGRKLNFPIHFFSFTITLACEIFSIEGYFDLFLFGGRGSGDADGQEW